jgi:hypothetical protein
MGLFGKIKKSFLKHFPVRAVEASARVVLDILVEQYLKENLLENPRYEGKKLNRHEFQVFSQGGEDGIIEEIFHRIGATDRYFVEFGVGNGSESNTTYLLLKDWRGLWIESGEKNVAAIRKAYGSLLFAGQLQVRQDFITAENIEEVFRQASVPETFDLLSIDIDRNDYWVWKAIGRYQPRVVVIEYNAVIPAHLEWIVRYEARTSWDGSSHQGASLKSLELLGARKGYRLVGCNFTGSNAFFVKEELVEDKFAEPFTAEHHYEPPRYFMARKLGHRRRFGEFVRDC